MRKPHKSTLRALAKRFRAWLLSLPEMRGFGEDLCCACAISSEALTRFFRREGFDAKFVEGQFEPECWEDHTNHCWVEVADKWIVDITATQFDDGFPGAHIVPLDDEDYIAFRRGPYALRHVRKEWPREQKPLGRKLPIPQDLAA